MQITGSEQNVVDPNNLQQHCPFAHGTVLGVHVAKAHSACKNNIITRCALPYVHEMQNDETQYTVTPDAIE